MPRPIYRELAKRIEKDFLQGNPSPRLPAIRSLAGHYGVAYRTAWSACRHLASWQKTPVSNAAPAARLKPAQRSGDAVRALADRVAKAIRNGDFHTRDPLPKFDYFVLTHRVTHKTVAGAFGILRKDGLIHKKGKSWIVGPSPAQNSRTSNGGAEKSPVILWVVRDHHSWYYTFNDVLLTPFVSALRSETTRRGIRLAMVLRMRPEEGTPYMPCGMDEARSFIRRMGNRYLGAVMHEHSIDKGDCRRWVHALSLNGSRPVVFFDSADMNPAYTRSRLDLHKTYYRCFFDEPAAIRLALEHLAGFGHQTVGFPISDNPKYLWARNRYDLAKRIAATIPGLRLIRTVHNEPFWHSIDLTIHRPSVSAFTKELTRYTLHSSRKAARDMQNTIIQRTKSMKELLDNGMTALVSMNDLMAFEHCWWCRAAGIDIPRRLSQISFDNIPQADGMPVTTIDFGFSRLGYLTAHAVIGDIRVSADREGNIGGIPLLVDRGSVAAPGDASELARKLRG
jgi:DNA-binding transcriptional regulator YhcF (GntR family)